MVMEKVKCWFSNVNKLALVYFTLSFAIVWALLNGSISDPTLRIEVLSFPEKRSQVFFKRDTSYSEASSVISQIDPTQTFFEFGLPLYDDQIRWDPLDRPGSFYVKSVNVSVLGYRVDVGLDQLSAHFQVEKSLQDGAAYFIAPVGAVDPQVIINIHSRHVDVIRLALVSGFSFFIALALVFWVFNHKNILAFFERDSKLVSNAKRFIDVERLSVAEFSTLLGIGVLLNIVPVVNFFLSVDDEIGAFRSDPSVWISDGRWTAFLVEKFLFPVPVIPFVPNLFFYVCLAIAYMFLLRACNLRFNRITAFAYCIFVAHPIWWFIGEFYSNLPSTGFGVMCLSLAVLISARVNNMTSRIGEKWVCITVASLFLALAIGSYQSLVMFYLALGLGAVILSIKDEVSLSWSLKTRDLKQAVVVFWVFAFGLIFYLIINKVFLYFNSVSRGYVESFLRLDELLADPGRIIKLTLNEMLKMYSGSDQSFGISFSSSAVVLGVAGSFLLVRKNLAMSVRMLFLVFAILISPFLLHFFTGALYLPLRSMLAISAVAWIAVLVVMDRKGSTQVVGVLLTSIMLFQMLSINAQYAASTMLATTHDRFTAESIYSRMAQIDPNFDRNGRVGIDVFGKLSFSTRYPSPFTSTMSSSFFNWDEGNVNRMIKYMRLVGLDNLYSLPVDQRIELTPKFKKMAAWPAEGSIRFEDGVFLIKLSEEPDLTHAQWVANDSAGRAQVQ